MKLELSRSNIQMVLAGVKEMITFWTVEDRRLMTGAGQERARQQTKAWQDLLETIEQEYERGGDL